MSETVRPERVIRKNEPNAGPGPVEAPEGIDERLDELGFDGAFGLALIEEALGVALVGGVVLGGQDDGLTC